MATILQSSDEYIQLIPLYLSIKLVGIGLRRVFPKLCFHSLSICESCDFKYSLKELHLLITQVTDQVIEKITRIDLFLEMIVCTKTLKKLATNLFHNLKL